LTLPPPVIRKLPLEVQSVLSKLANIERELVEESREHSWVWSGDNIVGRLVGRDIYSIGSMMKDFPELDSPPEREPPLKPDGVAIIPGYASGRCQPLLIVIMGAYDDQEKLILQTIEYVSACCRGVTKYVIFYAISWNGMAWADHRDSFRASKAISILKLLGSEPVVLNPLYLPHM
jgi:hypothetical protein